MKKEALCIAWVVLLSVGGILSTIGILAIGMRSDSHSEREAQAAGAYVGLRWQ